MPLLTIDDLVSKLSETQVLNSFTSILVSLGTPADKWRKGGVARNVLRAVARTYAGFTTLMSDQAKSGFRELATGGWLTLHARYTYNVERVLASFATGTVTLTNAGGGVYTLAVGALVVKNSATGKTYANTSPVTIGALATVTGVPMQAQEAGAASSSAPGTIDALVTVLSGVSVTNPAAFVGTDEQSDEDLRQTCRDKLGSLSDAGPRDAYAYAVRVALRGDGTPVDINRMAISSSSSTGTVDVWCASPTGTPLDSDLDAVGDSIEAIARPECVTVNVHGAGTVALSQTLTVWAEVTPGLDAAGVTDYVNKALLAMTRDCPIGGRVKPPATAGYLFASEIEGTILAAHPAIFAVDGATDLAIPSTSVPILTASITVRLVPRKEVTL